MANKPMRILSGALADEMDDLTLGEVCRLCGVHAECIIELVEEGALTPRGRSVPEWRFAPAELARARRALRLQRDLDVNLAGASLALDLLDEIQRLRSRLRRFDPWC